MQNWTRRRSDTEIVDSAAGEMKVREEQRCGEDVVRDIAKSVWWQQEPACDGGGNIGKRTLPNGPAHHPPQLDTLRLQG